MILTRLQSKILVVIPGSKQDALAYADLDISEFVNEATGAVKSLDIPLKKCLCDPSASIQVHVQVKFLNESLDDETKRLW
jgi:N-terminal C2 in EEIG1 and EHBP1 proteins